MTSGNLTTKNKNQSDFMPIKHWREDERPRERLIKFGPDSLSDSELLAILIGTGTVGNSAIDISRKLLSEFSSLSSMAKCDVTQFRQISGIGLAKAVTISAAFELSRRILKDPFSDKQKMNSTDEIIEFYKAKLKDLRTETFRIALLNSARQLFKEVVISEGILDSTPVHPREVFRPAIIESASAILLIHNHPSGNTEPSFQDKEITKKLVITGQAVGINVADHIIIAGNNHFSFKSAGLI